ncbi:hypothetical protein [Candidatus Neptunochlamydia vexilliferae]|uniref:hypothetical protein n=1 Tax=Candidatus Neptunichlamydia vexilliferae TaxID=1651774 RepID=UPI0018917D90|nr:hypothetical protein [Candidatus Neptunochlamydia vexilliferae]
MCKLFTCKGEQGLYISHKQLTKYAIQEADILIQMNFEDVGMFTDKHNRTIYKHGREKTRAMLPEIEAAIRKLRPE